MKRPSSWPFPGVPLRLLLLLGSGLVLTACAGTPSRETAPPARTQGQTRAPRRPAPQTPPRARRPAPRVERGIASYYHDSLAGRPTASGAPYAPEKATCAHRKLPFGTRVEVRVVDTGRKDTCVINDRGPFVKGRVIDVSRAVARRLGLLQRGLAEVEVRVLSRR